MKKLLSLLLVFILVLGLGACASSPDTPIDYYTKDEIDTMILEVNDKVDVVTSIMLNIGVIQGLSGQKEYFYKNESTRALASMPKDILKQTLLAMPLSELRMINEEVADINYELLPTYTYEENGDYISFKDLSNKILNKYMGVSVNVTESLFYGDAYILVKDYTSGLTPEEVFARMSLLVNELTEYGYYRIGITSLRIYYILYEDSNPRVMEITLPNVVINNPNSFNLTPTMIYNNEVDINCRLDNVTLNLATIEALFNQYILDDTFSGYVLNYTK